MFKKALIALAFVIGAQCASAALPAFNQKFEKNGQPIAEKPLVARDFIEFRTARGFPLDGYKDLAGNPQSLSQFKDKLVIVDVWGSWSATCQRSAPLMAEFQAKYNKPESRIRFVLAAKAIAAEEACTEEYRKYIFGVVKNCKAMCDEFVRLGYDVVTGGTDNHLFLLDLTDTGLTGREVQEELDRCGITLNKNCVPGDKRSPFQTSGVRIGTAAMTTKGYTAEDFCRVAHRIDEVVRQMMAGKAAQA